MTQKLKNISALKRDAGTNGNSVSLSDRVYEYLAERVIRGEIMYGDTLNIKQIAAQLHVSPMPIRDAIKRLEFEQVVTVKPRSNCYVATPSKRATLDAIESRRMIEVFAIRSYCDDIDAADLKSLRGILSHMNGVVHSGRTEPTEQDVREYVELDRQYHSEICRLAHNSYVDRFYRELSLHLSMSAQYGIGVCHGLGPTYEEHEKIVAHLSRNSSAAITVLDEHLIQSRRNVLTEESFLALPE